MPDAAKPPPNNPARPGWTPLSPAQKRVQTEAEPLVTELEDSQGSLVEHLPEGAELLTPDKLAVLEREQGGFQGRSEGGGVAVRDEELPDSREKLRALVDGKLQAEQRVRELESELSIVGTEHRAAVEELNAYYEKYGPLVDEEN